MKKRSAILWGILLSILAMVFLLSAQRLGIGFSERDAFPKPHPIKFGDREFAELTITSMLHYINNRNMIATVELFSLEYVDSKGRGIDDCRQNIEAYLRNSGFEKIMIDFSKIELVSKDDITEVRLKMRKSNCHAKWKKIIIILRNEKGNQRIFSSSQLLELLNERKSQIPKSDSQDGEGGQ